MNLNRFMLPPQDVWEVTTQAGPKIWIASVLYDLWGTDSDVPREEVMWGVLNDLQTCVTFAHWDAGKGVWDAFIVIQHMPEGSYYDRHAATIKAIYADPEADPKAIRYLIGAAVEHGRARGVTKVIALTDEKQFNRAYYERLGFKTRYIAMECAF